MNMEDVWPVLDSNQTCKLFLCLQSAANNAAQREVAKKERERLKLQGIAKKQQLEKLRAEQNYAAAAGDVRLLQLQLPLKPCLSHANASCLYLKLVNKSVTYQALQVGNADNLLMAFKLIFSITVQNRHICEAETS